MEVSKTATPLQNIAHLLAEFVELVRRYADSFFPLKGSAINIKLAVGNPAVGEQSSCPWMKSA